MLSGAPLNAILFDVGGPIVDEQPDFEHNLRIVSEVLEEELGREVERSDLVKARDRAIESWSPSFTKAIVWHFLKPDGDLTNAVYTEILRRMFTRRDDITLTEGIGEVVASLSGSYKLALAGNQPEFIKEKLNRTSLLTFFKSTALSADIGLSKPDSRFFLEICSRIEEAPENCCMVGDRLDNDIYPANVLGMRTVWLRVGPHAVQTPRVPEDVPDATIESISELLTVIEQWER